MTLPGILDKRLGARWALGPKAVSNGQRLVCPQMLGQVSRQRHCWKSLQHSEAVPQAVGPSPMLVVVVVQDLNMEIAARVLGRSRLLVDQFLEGRLAFGMYPENPKAFN